MDDLRGGPDLVRLDTVGGTVLLVRADVHRDGLIFPCFPYGAANPAVRRPDPLRHRRRTRDRGVRHHGDGHGVPVLGHAQSRGASCTCLIVGDAAAATADPLTYIEHIRLLSCEFEIRTNSRELADRLSSSHSARSRMCRWCSAAG